MKKDVVFILLCAALLISSACGTASPSESLAGIVWQWTAMQEIVPASQSVVPDPQNYNITFNADGTAEIKADCNAVGATYTTSGSSLTITRSASTLMYCGDASQHTIFLASLARVSSDAISRTANCSLASQITTAKTRNSYHRINAHPVSK